MFRYYFLLLYISTSVYSQNAQQEFWVNPPLAGPSGEYSANLKWQIGSLQTLEWITNYTSWELWMFQDNLAGGDPVAVASGTSALTDNQPTFYNWTVSTRLNYVKIPHFWFILYDKGGSRNINCHYFDIVDAVSASATNPTTASTNPATTAITPLTTSPISTTSSSLSSLLSSPTSSTTAPPTQAAGLSQGAQIGIGVTIPVVVIAALIAGFLLWRRRRRQQGLPSNTHELYGKGYGEKHQNQPFSPEMKCSSCGCHARATYVAGSDRDGVAPIYELSCGHGEPVELEHHTINANANPAVVG